MVQSLQGEDDAMAYTLRLSQEIRPDIGAVLEYTWIDDDPGAIGLAAYNVNKSVWKNQEADIRGFGGLRYIRGNHPVLSDFKAIAPQVGLSADYSLSKDLKLMGSAGFSFFDETLTELDANVSKFIDPGKLLSVGYKSYIAGGDSIGGPMVSFTWQH